MFKCKNNITLLIINDIQLYIIEMRYSDCQLNPTQNNIISKLTSNKLLENIWNTHNILHILCCLKMRILLLSILNQIHSRTFLFKYILLICDIAVG